MSGTAGETKELACRTQDLACVLEPVQSLGTYLWNLALFLKKKKKIGFYTVGFLRPNYPSLITPRSTVRDRRGLEVEVESRLTCFDFLWLFCYITHLQHV